jgi:hypothetical protein
MGFAMMIFPWKIAEIINNMKICTTQCSLKKTIMMIVRAHLIKLSGFQYLLITD